MINGALDVNIIHMTHLSNRSKTPHEKINDPISTQFD